MDRCTWAQTDLSAAYHDGQWCIPKTNDYELFKWLVLEGMQAGLSWELILQRQTAYEEAFFDKSIMEIATLSDEELMAIKENFHIIKHDLKIKSIRTNAQEFLKVQVEFGSFANYIWSFTENKQIIHLLHTTDEMPSQNELSQIISKDLKKKGFKFVGPTIIYSYLQAIGIIDDHLLTCPYKRKDAYEYKI